MTSQKRKIEKTSKYIICEKAPLWFFSTDVHTFYCILLQGKRRLINIVYTKKNTGWFNSCYNNQNHHKEQRIYSLKSCTPLIQVWCAEERHFFNPSPPLINTSETKTIGLHIVINTIIHITIYMFGS